jgi:hypothetical protein
MTRSAAELWDSYQQAKADDLPPYERGRIYRDWLAACFREGHDPTRLEKDSPLIDERIDARSLPGLNGCLIWDGPRNEHGQPIVYVFDPETGGSRTLTVRRYVLQRTGRQVSLRRRVLPFCGTSSCVNPDHLQVEEGAWNTRYSTENMLGRLQAWALKHGKPPTRAAWEKTKSLPSCRAYVMRFGSWSEAKRRAGLE